MRSLSFIENVLIEKIWVNGVRLPTYALYNVK